MVYFITFNIKWVFVVAEKILIYLIRVNRWKLAVIKRRFLVSPLCSSVWVKSKNWWSTVFGRVRLKNDRWGAANATSRATQSQRNLPPFIHHCRRRLPFATHAQIWTASLRFADGKTTDRPVPKRYTYINYKWRLNANAAAGRNVHLYLDELLEKTYDDVC